MDKLLANLAARFPDLTQDDISLSVDIIIEAMSARLINGGRIELRGFGSFGLHAQVDNKYENAMLETSEYDTKQPSIIFKPGLIIREKVNNAA